MSIMESILMIESVDKENSNGLVGMYIKVNTKMMKEMDMVK
jgi:hypothetical protein